RPELNPLRVAYTEILEQGDVPLLLAGIPQDVASGIAERAGGRRGERRRVEHEVLIGARSIGELSVDHPGRGIADEVVRLAEVAVAHARDVVRPAHRERRAGSEEAGAGNLPAAQSVLQRGV